MIKKGQIVTNFSRTWFGVFDRWYKKPNESAHWSYCLDPRGNVYKMSSEELISGAYPVTGLERQKFKKALIKAGFTYYKGKVIQEL